MIVTQLVERDGQLLFDGKPLRDGDWLQLLVYDGLRNRPVWIDTQVIHCEGGFWCAVGALGYQLNGLFARL